MIGNSGGTKVLSHGSVMFEPNRFTKPSALMFTTLLALCVPITGINPTHGRQTTAQDIIHIDGMYLQGTQLTPCQFKTVASTVVHACAKSSIGFYPM